jgi:hypothetical protein
MTKQKLAGYIKKALPDINNIREKIHQVDIHIDRDLHRAELHVKQQHRDHQKQLYKKIDNRHKYIPKAADRLLEQLQLNEQLVAAVITNPNDELEHRRKQHRLKYIKIANAADHADLIRRAKKHCEKRGYKIHSLDLINESALHELSAHRLADYSYKNMTAPDPGSRLASIFSRRKLTPQQIAKRRANHARGLSKALSRLQNEEQQLDETQANPYASDYRRVLVRGRNGKMYWRRVHRTIVV